MNCPNCGTQNPPNAAFCARCAASLYAQPPGMAPGMQPGMPPQGMGMQPPPMGMPPQGMGWQPGMQPGMMGQPMTPKTSGMAVAGFILSFFCSLIGLILSAVAYSQVKKSNGMLTGGGLALAGIIIGAINFLVGLAVWPQLMHRGHF